MTSELLKTNPGSSENFISPGLRDNDIGEVCLKSKIVSA